MFEKKPRHPPAYDELRSRLHQAGISLNNWESGNAKGLGHLYREIAEGDAELVEIDGNLQRHIQVAMVEIIATADGQLRRLVETKQYIRSPQNGEVVRKRSRDLSTSLGEKAKFSEPMEQAAVRGITEELRGKNNEQRLFLDAERLIPVARYKEIRDSSSYPGLQTIADNYVYILELTDQEYLENRGGFMEINEKQISHFSWVSVSDEELETY